MRTARKLFVVVLAEAVEVVRALGLDAGEQYYYSAVRLRGELLPPRLVVGVRLALGR